MTRPMTVQIEWAVQVPEPGTPEYAHIIEAMIADGALTDEDIECNLDAIVRSMATYMAMSNFCAGDYDEMVEQTDDRVWE